MARDRPSVCPLRVFDPAEDAVLELRQVACGPSRDAGLLLRPRRPVRPDRPSAVLRRRDHARRLRNPDQAARSDREDAWRVVDCHERSHTFFQRAATTSPRQSVRERQLSVTRGAVAIVRGKWQVIVRGGPQRFARRLARGAALLTKIVEQIAFSVHRPHANARAHRPFVLAEKPRQRLR
jgi:hypothetical protein